MKKTLLILAIATMLFGCTDIRTEYSDVIHERATVVTLIYSPSEHKTELKQTLYHQDGIVGTDIDGNQGLRVGKDFQVTSTTIPEKFGVAFQCQHGTFTIEGSDTKHRVLSNKMANSIRDTVEILYREVYRVTYEKDEKTGQKKETHRVLSDLDFIDAQIIKK